MGKQILASPDGSGIEDLFGGTFKSLNDFGTTRLVLGTKIEISHLATGADLTYVLVAGAAPSANVWSVAPSDYNAVTNDVHWKLQRIFKDGQPALWNKDIDSPNGGFNIQQAISATNPTLALDSALVILKTAFN
ncbi:MAG: hypothetical protein ACXABY_22400 [Candidatus Thorarchaeota archaeon]|jgi:hypothetical protein